MANFYIQDQEKKINIFYLLETALVNHYFERIKRYESCTCMIYYREVNQTPFPVMVKLKQNFSADCSNMSDFPFAKVSMKKRIFPSLSSPAPPPSPNRGNPNGTFNWSKRCCWARDSMCEHLHYCSSTCLWTGRMV